MKTYDIAVLPGDGIGPEVMDEALKVLDKASVLYGFKFNYKKGLIGGSAYNAEKTPLPLHTVDICMSSDAVLLGSIGGPEWDALPPKLTPEIGGLLALRKKLSLYANVRPAVVYEELKAMSPLSERVLSGKVDYVTVRELAYGIYFGEPKVLSDTEGLDTMRYRKDEIIPIAEFAFELAMKRKKKLCSVDKANVLSSSKMWRKTVIEVAERYPEVELTHMYVDNAAMQQILNPLQFDVILTTNMFGDILSDESAAICGSLGMLPSASLGSADIHLYEPAGGSAPDIAGKGIANPAAQILSAAMMLDTSFGETEAAACIQKAVDMAVKEGCRTADIALDGITPVSTRVFSDRVLELMVK